jgi:large conductance mechanosensitive channel
VRRDDLITIAAGLTVALGAFTLIQAVVTSLLMPLISVFVGASSLELNYFTIRGDDFRYGAVIEALITLALILAAVHFLVLSYRSRQGRESAAAETRACPECTSSISAAAKRCPHCTAVVRPAAV